MADEPARGSKVLPGEVIAGRFVVERAIGSGSMGEVVSARHVELGNLVAIKVIRGDVLDDPDAVGRFKREVRALAKLTSVHAVRIYDVGETSSGLPYLIMEHLAGRDLASVLAATGPLPVDEALDFMIQACDALTEAHDAGIVHRDLKLQNLFLTKKKSGEGHIRVLDFGLAKSLRTTSTIKDLRLTTEGAVIGTAHYMAPEQITGAPVSARTDVWAVGACLFRLLTARHPFKGTSAPEVCDAVVTRAPIRIKDLRPDLPADVEAIVMRCLEKDPTQRPDTRQLRGLLEQARRGKPASVPPARANARETEPRSAWKAAIVLGSALALVGVVTFLAVARARRTTQVRLAPVGLIAPAMAQVPSMQPSMQPSASPPPRTAK